MYPELLAHIKRYVQLTAAEEQLLCEKLEPKTLKKKAFLLEAGKHCHGNYFVVKGCLRLYFVNNKLNEQIIQFGIENWWITDYDGLTSKQPSTCYIQAVEPSEVLLLSEKNQAILFEQIPCLETYFRIMMQKAYVASQRRIGYIFNLTEEERYIHFSSRFPDFLQRVPQYMLASYLGFTPQFLSRLRAKKI
ncbi:Crp/Fnr family transcriptional regulator [Mucilaginibacter sp. OK098]|uniref:Crp/Fnr family transcriptional regulator n=1 Tax=Mucilaginibacter sp. OK098 TaxID=1855297 RepID=UPI000921D6E1|nr:Crp/Fnr family transcriptional regulator [Mucilaginibacter sp. OK098]SHM04099.1 cAMP-binding domain of CRP or a regulatory subunit of cAMP-dependent protein kinases [Mucilaginibacter sp. OK098]